MSMMICAKGELKFMKVCFELSASDDGASLDVGSNLLIKCEEKSIESIFKFYAIIKTIENIKQS